MEHSFQDSHFDWNLHQDQMPRDCDDTIGKLDGHLRDNPGVVEIEALLFKSFLLVSPSRKRDIDTDKAVDYLGEARNKIGQCENNSAKDGYLLVYHTLNWHVHTILQDAINVEKCRKEIEAIKVRLTEACFASVNATRAFALSFLGSTRHDDCLLYYEKAKTVAKDDTNVDWLFGLALTYGRKSRFANDPEALEKAKELYNTILEKNEHHMLALLFVAEIEFGEKHKATAKEKFEKAMRLAREKGGHQAVFVRVARFLRKDFKFTAALELLDEAKEVAGNAPYPMLFHQKATVYLNKYNKYARLYGLALKQKLPGETGEKSSLLLQALTHLDEAIKRSSTEVIFTLNRADVYEKLQMHSKESQDYKSLASQDYKSLLKKIPDLHVKQKIQVYVIYGLYLHRTNDDLARAMNYLSKGIELAAESKLYNNIPEFDYTKVVEAAEVYDKENANQLRSGQNFASAEAAYRMAWLRLLLSDVSLKESMTNVLKCNCANKTPLQMYEHAYKEIRSYLQANANREIPVLRLTVDIIQGLIVCHLNEGRKEDFELVEKYVQELKTYDFDAARLKRADWKIIEGEQKASDDEQAKLFIDAVREGSLDACEELSKWLRLQHRNNCASYQSDLNHERYCLEIEHCLSTKKLIYRQSNFGGMLLHNSCDGTATEIKIRADNVTKRLQGVMQEKGDGLDELRKEYRNMLRLELNNKQDDGRDKKMIPCAIKVMYEARSALNHVSVWFDKNFCEQFGLEVEKRKEREFQFIKREPKFNDKPQKGGKIKTREELVATHLQDLIENKGGKLGSWPQFTLYFPHLFRYLVEIQPAAHPDGSYDWLITLHEMKNKYYHREPHTEPKFEISVGVDKHQDKNNPTTYICRTFDVRKVAEKARFEVENIVSEFKKLANFDLSKFRIRPFSARKSLCIERYKDL